MKEKCNIEKEKGGVLGCLLYGVLFFVLLAFGMRAMMQYGVWQGAAVIFLPLTVAILIPLFPSKYFEADDECVTFKTGYTKTRIPYSSIMSVDTEVVRYETHKRSLLFDGTRFEAKHLVHYFTKIYINCEDREYVFIERHDPRKLKNDNYDIVHEYEDGRFIRLKKYIEERMT